MGQCCPGFALSRRTELQEPLNRSSCEPEPVFGTPRSAFKVLLLGAGDSGKSTFCRQLKLLFANGFTEEERRGFTWNVHEHVLQGFQCLVSGAQTLSCLTESEDREATPFLLLSESKIKLLTAKQGEVIQNLWKSPGLQEAWRRRLEWEPTCGMPMDAMDGFIEDLGRLTDPYYLPTIEDIIKVRTKTTGVSKLAFEHGGVQFDVVDVGGQRAERRKWAQAFQNVNAVVFCAALSEFDQTLYESRDTNRMKESIELFGSIVNGPFFKESSVILLLTKRDLFHDKIGRTDLRTAFPHFDGPAGEEPALDFIRKEFIGVKSADKEVYVDVANTTDSTEVNRVFRSVVEVAKRQLQDKC